MDKNVNSFDARLHDFCINSIINTETLRDDFKTIINYHYTTADLAEAESVVNLETMSSSATTHLLKLFQGSFCW